MNTNIIYMNMKNFTISMVIICFCISFSFAQTSNKINFKKAKQETSVKSYDVSNEIQPRMGGIVYFQMIFLTHQHGQQVTTQVLAL